MRLKIAGAVKIANRASEPKRKLAYLGASVPLKEMLK